MIGLKSCAPRIGPSPRWIGSSTSSPGAATSASGARPTGSSTSQSWPKVVSWGITSLIRSVPRCIFDYDPELNYTPDLGGWATGMILQKFAPTSRFIAEHGLAIAAVNTIAILLDHAVARLGCRDGEVNTVFVLSAGEPLSNDPADLRYLDSEYSAACRRRGVSGRALACHPGDLSLHKGSLLFHGDLRITWSSSSARNLTSPLTKEFP